MSLRNLAKLRCVMPVSLWVALSSSVLGQEDLRTRTAEQSFNDGVALMQTAESADSVDEKISSLRLAIEQFRAFVAIRPDSYPAHAAYARALDSLVRQSASSKTVASSQRLQWAQEALQRFSIAEKYAASDWKNSRDWGNYLMYYAESFAANQSERAASLAQARELFEKAMQRAALRTDQASLECRLGECLVRLATAQTVSDGKRVLYQLAADKFQSAHEESAAMIDADVFASWGKALLEIGKIDSNPKILLQAVERLQSSLRNKPENLEARFNLIRAYALLNQTDDALQELRVCAETDATRTSIWALAEPDLASLRDAGGFQEIVTGKTAGLAAEFVFRAGLDFQRQAEKAAQPVDALVLFNKAIEQYEKVATARPDYYAAQLLWGHCLSKLCQLSTSASQRQSWAKSARERFAIASRCKDADWRIYYDWAALLTSQVNVLATPHEDANALLREANGLFEKSLALTRFSGDKAIVEHDSAMCLIALAERTASVREKRPLYDRAIDRLDFAAEKSPQIMTAHSYGLWGVALLQVAKLDGNQMMMRKAIERLLTSLEMNPKDGETRYNLVCAYALLEQPDNALRHLRICLDNDPNRIFYNTAASDPDLWSLRRTAEYYNIFKAHPNPEPLGKPRLSER